MIWLRASVAKDYPSFLRFYLGTPSARGLSKVCAVRGWGEVHKCEESLVPIDCVEDVRYRRVNEPSLQKEILHTSGALVVSLPEQKLNGWSTGDEWV